MLDWYNLTVYYTICWQEKGIFKKKKMILKTIDRLTVTNIFSYFCHRNTYNRGFKCFPDFL